MQPTFNKKQFFYDYLPHLPLMRLRTDFHLGYYEQTIVRNEIQKVIRNAFGHLMDTHDLKHVNVYPEIGEEFDQSFYNELRTLVLNTFRKHDFWDFLDAFIPKLGPDDNGTLYLKLTASLGSGIPRINGNGPVLLKEAFVKIIIFDLDALNGQELLYLTKIS